MVILCLALIAFRQGDYHKLEDYLKKSEAEEKLKKAIRINPNNFQAHLELGNLYFQKANLYYETSNNKIDKKKDEIKKAIDYFEKAQENGVGGAYVLALIQNKEYKKAFEKAEALRQALRHQDSSEQWQSHLTLSYLLLCRGDKARLPQWFCSLLSKFPWLSEFSKKTSRTYYEEALKEANQAKILKLTHPDAYFYSGIIQYKLRDYGSALEDFKICLENTSEKSELYYEVKRYINYVELLARSPEDAWSIKKLRIILLLIMFGELVIYWILSSRDIIEKKEFVSFLGIVAIALWAISFLPFLSRFKLPGGFEAEMIPPKVRPPEIPIVSGPNDEVGFCSLSPTITSSGWLGSKPDRPE